MGSALVVAGKKAGRSVGSATCGRSLGLPAGSTIEMVQQVRRGFPYAAIIRFQKLSGLSLGVIADLVQIPPRTLIRRKAVGRLRPDESERLLRISGVFEKAVDLFEGDVVAARGWLNAPNDELAGHSPLDFARTEIGGADVEDLIGRLEHGVFT